jgi:hypothetical protein
MGIAKSIISANQNKIIEYLIFIPLPVVTLAAHYAIWLSSSRKGSSLFYGLLVFGVLAIFIIYPGATALTKNTLRYMSMGGGMEVELYLNKSEFLSIAKPLSIKADPACEYPCTTGKVQLILDLGDVLYVRPITENIEKENSKDNENKEEINKNSAESILRSVAIKRISIISIVYHGKES